MDILRTPDESFDAIKNYPYAPNYTVVKTHDGSDLRVHHIDEGAWDSPVILCMHGQPVWSYLYTKMVPHLVAGGLRVIAPDLPGYGKSDKPASRADYSYQRQVDWMTQWLELNDFSNLSFFGQDWGGLIGLRMISENSERFERVAIGNTGLPYNPDFPEEAADKIKRFREDSKKLTLFSMRKEVAKMDGFKESDGLEDADLSAMKFAYWQKYTWETPDLPAGVLASSMMDDRGPLGLGLELLFRKLGLAKLSPFSTETSLAFEAPFPDTSYKMGIRAMPSHVPSIPDQSLDAQKKAWEFFEKFEKPFLCVGAGDDPVTNGFEKPWLEKVPGTKGQPHANIGGGHFLQWTRAEELSKVLVDFVHTGAN